MLLHQSDSTLRDPLRCGNFKPVEKPRECNASAYWYWWCHGHNTENDESECNIVHGRISVCLSADPGNVGETIRSTYCLRHCNTSLVYKKWNYRLERTRQTIKVSSCGDLLQTSLFCLRVTHLPGGVILRELTNSQWLTLWNILILFVLCMFVHRLQLP